MDGRWFRVAALSILALALTVRLFTLLHMIFVSSLRYRQPAMLLFAVLAAAVVLQWYDARCSAVSKEVPA